MDIDSYIQRIISLGIAVDEVWLLGSRANRTERKESDWDLFLFTDAAGLSCLTSNNYLKDDRVDLLVVYDGNNFEEPWPTIQAKAKSGNLRDWVWSRLSDDEAEYKTIKSTPEWYKNNQAIETKIFKARKLWPKQR
ncbi:MAG TPA: nucleotidyltransferase domain-containing protein [Verrucomicrobiae bacterium]|nr:nucleotidyltransferase domain-containing protein [Verrucomicrobiae bacterium]